jgi:hypothetical protein
MSDDDQVDMTGGESATSELRDQMLKEAAEKSGMDLDRFMDVLESCGYEDGGFSFEDRGHRISMKEFELGKPRVWLDGAVVQDDTLRDKLANKYMFIATFNSKLSEATAKHSAAYERGEAEELLN